MKNFKFNSNDVKKIVENKLDVDFREAKENNGWFKLNGKKKKRITIPKGRKSIPRKTYSSMATQLGISISEFDDLLECPLTREMYEKIIS